MSLVFTLHSRPPTLTLTHTSLECRQQAPALRLALPSRSIRAPSTPIASQATCVCQIQAADHSSRLDGIRDLIATRPCSLSWSIMRMYPDVPKISSRPELIPRAQMALPRLGFPQHLPDLKSIGCLKAPARKACILTSSGTKGH